MPREFAITSWRGRERIRSIADPIDVLVVEMPPISNSELAGGQIGFVTVGIAFPNGILLVSHYEHLQRADGMAFGLQ